MSGRLDGNVAFVTGGASGRLTSPGAVTLLAGCTGFSGFATRPTRKKDPPLWGVCVCATGQNTPGKPANPRLP
jgi:hypothetical protein